MNLPHASLLMAPEFLVRDENSTTRFVTDRYCQLSYCQDWSHTSNRKSNYNMLQSGIVMKGCTTGGFADAHRLASIKPPNCLVESQRQLYFFWHKIVLTYKRYSESNVMMLLYVHDARANYESPWQFFRIYRLIQTLFLELDHDSTEEYDRSTRHGPTVPVENRPRHVSYNNLVTQYIAWLVEQTQAELQDSKKAHTEVVPGLQIRIIIANHVQTDSL